jgi:hypothetical protein
VVEALKAGLRLSDRRDAVAAEFLGAVALVRALPLRELKVPRGLESLPQVVTAIQNDLRALAASGPP